MDKYSIRVGVRGRNRRPFGDFVIPNALLPTHLRFLDDAERSVHPVLLYQFTNSSDTGVIFTTKGTPSKCYFYYFWLFFFTTNIKTKRIEEIPPGVSKCLMKLGKLQRYPLLIPFTIEVKISTSLFTTPFSMICWFLECKKSLHLFLDPNSCYKTTNKT